jgi:excisionase family DNA binding protein
MKQPGGKKRKGPGRPRGKRNASGPPVESDVMTLKEVADYLNCHYGTAYRLAQLGVMPSFKLGGHWRVVKSEIDQWIAKGGGRR